MKLSFTLWCLTVVLSPEKGAHALKGGRRTGAAHNKEEEEEGDERDLPDFPIFAEFLDGILGNAPWAPECRSPLGGRADHPALLPVLRLCSCQKSIWEILNLFPLSTMEVQWLTFLGIK